MKCQIIAITFQWRHGNEVVSLHHSSHHSWHFSLLFLHSCWIGAGRECNPGLLPFASPTSLMYRQLIWQLLGVHHIMYQSGESTVKAHLSRCSTISNSEHRLQCYPCISQRWCQYVSLLRMRFKKKKKKLTKVFPRSTQLKIEQGHVLLNEESRRITDHITSRVTTDVSKYGTSSI